MRYFNRYYSIAVFFVLFIFNSKKYLNAQITTPALVGYFHNWNDANAPYIPLDQVDVRYNIIDVSFATPIVGTDYKMQFVPDQVSQATFINQIQTLQSQGRKVLISIGGATAPITLDNIQERDTFIATMSSIISTYGFDGIDIDLEGSSLSLSGGSISNPTDASIINMIGACKQLMVNFRIAKNKKMILTMAPETAFVQGGQSAYAGIWGAYLPVIHALRDSLDLLHVQLYNSGTMYGIDGNIYQQGTADFIVAMCEAVIHGFNTQGGMFNGLPAHKIAAGLPACTSAAGGGYCHPDTVKAAINYLRGVGSKPGNYTLVNASGYPNFGGLMTWSINWDAVASCGSSYQFANNFTNIYGTTSTSDISDEKSKGIKIYPNPCNQILNIELGNAQNENTNLQFYNSVGQLILIHKMNKSSVEIDVTNFAKGFYYIKAGNINNKFVVE